MESQSPSSSTPRLPFGHSLHHCVFAVVVLVLGLSPLCAGQVPDTTHGTLIGAYGNAKGIVIVTDSMVSTRDPNGNMVPVPENPGQKLLRLDDYTVCAIAGLGGKRVVAAPTLSSDILGIIDSYNRQSGRERVSMERTLRNIEGILQFYIENTTIIDIETNQLTNLPDLKVELLLAGYDIDGQPKIGSSTIEVRQPPIQAPFLVPPPVEAVVSEHDLTVIGKTFTQKTRGINDVAKAILDFPSYFTESSYPILRTYARAKVAKGDNGSSLSVDDMERLGKTLIELTPSPFVGGSPQVAILENGKIKNIEQQSFRHQLVSPFGFTVMRNSSFFPGVGSSVVIRGGRLTVFFDHVTFRGDKRPASSFPNALQLDNNIFVGCRFINQVLSWDGAPFYLDDSDVWDNTDIFVGPNGQNNLAVSRWLRDKAQASKH
jgi:hypothetical protein